MRGEEQLAILRVQESASRGDAKKHEAHADH